MATVNIYLTFNGDCEKAFRFYESAFGTKISYIERYKNIPSSQEGMKIEPGEEEKIMHVTLPISNETRLMGCDASLGWVSNYSRGNNFSISIDTDSKEEADRIFMGLSKGGIVTMPLAQTFWSEYFGVLTDQFGISWMVGVR
jgi:PhnB protein